MKVLLLFIFFSISNGQYLLCDSCICSSNVGPSSSGVSVITNFGTNGVITGTPQTTGNGFNFTFGTGQGTTTGNVIKTTGSIQTTGNVIYTTGKVGTTGFGRASSTLSTGLNLTLETWTTGEQQGTTGKQSVKTTTGIYKTTSVIVTTSTRFNGTSMEGTTGVTNETEVVLSGTSKIHNYESVYWMIVIFYCFFLFFI
jgi:hypothetical protein